VSRLRCRDMVVIVPSNRSRSRKLRCRTSSPRARRPLA
jgi:hypothetical protein